MALRLAGEEFSVVQGLDGQGWVKETQAATFKTRDIDIGGNKLKSTNLLMKELDVNTLGIMNAAGDALRNLRVADLAFSDLGPIGAADAIHANDSDGAALLLKARWQGTGLSEVARLQGGNPPTFDLLRGRLTGDFNLAGYKVVNWPTALTAIAGAQTLPSNPEGFLVIQVSGVDKKVPYYGN